MSMQYIRDNYHVPAKRGGRIKYTGESKSEPLFGTITSAQNARLRVRFDNDYFGKHPVTLHPTWEVEYLEPNAMERGAK